MHHYKFIWQSERLSLKDKSLEIFLPTKHFLKNIYKILNKIWIKNVLICCRRFKTNSFKSLSKRRLLKVKHYKLMLPATRLSRWCIRSRNYSFSYKIKSFTTQTAAGRPEQQNQLFIVSFFCDCEILPLGLTRTSNVYKNTDYKQL